MQGLVAWWAGTLAGMPRAQGCLMCCTREVAAWARPSRFAGFWRELSKGGVLLRRDLSARLQGTDGSDQASVQGYRGLQAQVKPQYSLGKASVQGYRGLTSVQGYRGLAAQVKPQCGSGKASVWLR